MLKSGALLFLFIQSAPVSAAQDINTYNGPIIGEDLTFPPAPEPFGYAKANKMFKPAGTGPFPALVILPTCGGHAVRHSFDVWAKAALQRGYAVLVVDVPLRGAKVRVPGQHLHVSEGSPHCRDLTCRIGYKSAMSAAT